jgi:ribonuclease III
VILQQKESGFSAPPVSKERRQELQLFQKYAQVRFRSLELLNLAFAHRSYANELGIGVDDNEKLEFLGDSVLGLVVSDYLVRTLRDKNEGDLARIKSFVVSEASLAGIARGLRVDNFILVGRGEEFSGGRSRDTLLADALEAIIGAYYVDSGFRPAADLVNRFLIPEINLVLEDRHEKDYKSMLQELAQQKLKAHPRYRVVERRGPEHERTFVVEVAVRDQDYGPGEGKNKKTAEQAAAAIAYAALTAPPPRKSRPRR